MEVCHYTTAAYCESGCSIIFATATVGSVGSDSGGLVDTAATVLVLVAMLSSLACAREPFKTKLIFSESHKIIYWCARRDLNPQSTDYESAALTIKLQAQCYIVAGKLFIVNSFKQLFRIT